MLLAALSTNHKAIPCRVQSPKDPWHHDDSALTILKLNHEWLALGYGRCYQALPMLLQGRPFPLAVPGHVELPDCV